MNESAVTLREKQIQGGTPIAFLAIMLLAYMLFPNSANALQFTIEKNADVVGYTQVIKTAYKDTFTSLARVYDVALAELIAANPGIDQWVPGRGTRVVIPTKFVLPAGKREGIIINLAELRLYYFLPNGRTVFTYPIAIGKQTWPTPTANTRVVGKEENPTWHIPLSIQREHRAQGKPHRTFVPPGPKNPLGKHAIRLGIRGYLIHGTNAPAGVGRRISHGCIRMYPEDIAHLFPHVRPGTPVRIVHQPHKVGFKDNQLYVEVHKPLVGYNDPGVDAVTHMVKKIAQQETISGVRLNNGPESLKMIGKQATGIPYSVGSTSSRSIANGF